MQEGSPWRSDLREVYKPSGEVTYIAPPAPSAELLIIVTFASNKVEQSLLWVATACCCWPGLKVMAALSTSNPKLYPDVDPYPLACSPTMHQVDCDGTQVWHVAALHVATLGTTIRYITKLVHAAVQQFEHVKNFM